MALRHIPGLRILGEEPDEVEVTIRVTGARARDVAAALARNMKAPSEVIPFSIGIPGLDRITGGVLTDTDLSADRLYSEVEISLTVQATVERDADG